MANTEQVRGLLALLELKGVGPGTVKRNMGQIRTSLAASDLFGALSSVIGDKANEGDWQSALGKADQHLERCDAVAITMISMLDPQYPSSLMELGTPPPVLFCRGNLSLLSSSTLGVIGTRKSNPFGETVAGRIGRHFADSGVSLCNGLADGIDICAVTQEDAFLPRVVGVMACGVDLLEVNISSKRTTERASKLLDADGLLVSRDASQHSGGPEHGDRILPLAGGTVSRPAAGPEQQRWRLPVYRWAFLQAPENFGICGSSGGAGQRLGVRGQPPTLSRGCRPRRVRGTQDGKDRKG